MKMAEASRSKKKKKKMEIVMGGYERERREGVHLSAIDSRLGKSTGVGGSSRAR
jgi:hypothetical protein